MAGDTGLLSCKSIEMSFMSWSMTCKHVASDIFLPLRMRDRGEGGGTRGELRGITRRRFLA